MKQVILKINLHAIYLSFPYLKSIILAMLSELYRKIRKGLKMVKAEECIRLEILA